MTNLTFDMFASRCRALAGDSVELTDEELKKLFISHSVITKWQDAETQKELAKAKRRAKR